MTLRDVSRMADWRAPDNLCLSNAQAAAVLGISPKTLPNWRLEGRSPPFVRVGRRVVYRRADLEQWLNDRTVR